MKYSAFSRKVQNYLNLWYLKYHNISVGDNVEVWGRPIINNRGEIVVKDNVRLFSDPNIYESTMSSPVKLSCRRGAKLEIGEGTTIYGASILAGKKVTIGMKCLIAANVNILDDDTHSTDPSRTNALETFEAPIILHDNVWLALNVTVLKGVTIGNNSVVGAGAVVTKDIPDNCIAAGNPARIIKKLQ